MFDDQRVSALTLPPFQIAQASSLTSGSEKEPTVTATATAACGVERTKATVFGMRFRGLTMDIIYMVQGQSAITRYDEASEDELKMEDPSSGDHVPWKPPIYPAFSGRLSGVGIHNIHHAQTILQHTMPVFRVTRNRGDSTGRTREELSGRWNITI